MLKVSERIEDDAVIVDLEGAIEGGESCRAIHKVIGKSLETGHRNIVLNLSEVDWINSMGVGFLVAASVSAVRQGATVRACGLTPRVDTLLRACSVVPHVWKDYPDVESALASF